jgi:hypothetical protein
MAQIGGGSFWKTIPKDGKGTLRRNSLRVRQFQ